MLSTLPELTRPVFPRLTPDRLHFVFFPRAQLETSPLEHRMENATLNHANRL
jgi:hypothetical protein